LYDLQGKLLGEQRMHNGDQVPLAKLGLAAGNYYYMIAGETMIERGRFVVLKGR
jgi:hypothetical protein